MRRIEYSRTRMYWRNIKLFMLFWTAVIIVSLFWSLHSQRQGIEASLYSQAAAIHSMEMEYRNWVIHNGGVYVPVSDMIRPNPWLSHVPERDIKTPSGKLLTLLNSSYVVRLVHEAMLTSGSTLRAHIASPKPINPSNAADAWERQALDAFARGAKESASFDVLEDGKTYYRYMKPMVTEESCLKCHARFGDRLGDIRGGVSVAIPVDVVMLAGRSERNAMIAGHGLIWGLGLVGLFVGGRKQQQALQTVEKSEETLRTNEERLHLATTAGNIGIWDWDVVRNELAWDESMYSLYGIRKEDFGGAYDAWIRTLHPDDRQFTDGEIQAALRGEREYAPEFRIIRPDGTVRNIKAASKTYRDPQGKSIRMVGTNIDITDRKKAEEVTRAASQYARSLIEASLDPLVTINAQGKITDVNQATEAVTGRNRSELIGTDFSDNFTDSNKAREGYQQVFAKGFVTDYPLALRHRDGHVTDVLYNASIYRNEAGEVLGVFAAARDVTERNKAEQEVTQLSLQNRLILDSAGEGIYGLDINGLCTFVNPAASQLLGFGVKELLGQHSHYMFHHTKPDGRPYPEEDCPVQAAYKQGTLHRGNDLYWRKDGSSFPVEFISTPILESGKITGAVVAFRDITERKLTEEQLRRSEHGLSEAQRIAHLGNWELDLVHNVLTWSDEIYRIFEIDPKKFGASYDAFLNGIHPDDREMVNNAYTESVKSKTPYDIEHRLLMNDGRVKYVNEKCETHYSEDGKPLVSVGTVHDITERKKIEMELRELNSDFVTLLENSGDFIYFKDKDSRIRFCSQTMANITGHHSWRDMIGKHDLEIFPEDTARIYYEEELPIFRDGKPLLNKTDPYHDDQGKMGWVNTNKWPVFGDDKKTVVGIFGISRDITELKEAEDKVNELNRNLERRVDERTAQLEVANKELEAFSYSVSHDLRTPLRAIDGFSHILLEDYADKLDDEGKRLLNVVRDNTSRMGQLIEDILKFSRTGRMELTFSEIDMEKLAHEVVEELQPSIAEGKLQLEIEHLPPAKGDSAMMRQVFVNLLSNAIKFSRNSVPAKIKVGGSINGDEAIYYVQDNGAGFDMQYAGKLFGVFQRLHGVTEFEGTGIGLAIVKRIITRHGGRVWAEGKVNEGATIYFALPTKEADHG